MHDQVVLITGATSGIGLEAAKQIAAKGATLHIVGRDPIRAANALAEIKNHCAYPRIHSHLADLSSQSSIRNLATELQRQISQLDVLINNAGALFPSFSLSEDGIEMTIATNHLSGFLLTHLLLDPLKRAPAARIINIASDAHAHGRIDFDSFTAETPKPYRTFKAYAQSKLANVLFTRELANRLSDTPITANCLHPGFVKTRIGNKHLNPIASAFWSLITRIGGLSVEQGAQSTTHLASSPETALLTGQYFVKSQPTPPAKIARNPDLQTQLWNISKQLTHLTDTDHPQNLTNPSEIPTQARIPFTTRVPVLVMLESRCGTPCAG